MIKIDTKKDKLKLWDYRSACGIDVDRVKFLTSQSNSVRILPYEKQKKIKEMNHEKNKKLN